jgi:hypothetical protein
MASSQQANIRRAWLSERIGDGKSDAKLIALAAATFRVSEKTIKKDLDIVYERWIEIYEASQPGRIAQFMELGLTLLEECRDAGSKSLHYGPAVAQFKNLAIMAGVMREGLMGKQEPATQGETRPSDQDIRERIVSLQKDPKVRERAMKAGLDLEDKT